MNYYYVTRPRILIPLLNRYGVIAACALCWCAVSATAHANTGVPLISVFLPPMWLALIPVILLESVLLARQLSIPSKATFWPVAVGNIASTLVGIPLSWMVLALLQATWFGETRGLGTFGAKVYAVTLQAPWLIPYEKDLGWMIPAALAVMALPCYAVSVVVEASISRRLLPRITARKVWRATFLANAASYFMLAALFWPTLKLYAPVYEIIAPITGIFPEIVFRLARWLHGVE